MSIEKPQKVIKKVVEKTTELFCGILSNHQTPNHHSKHIPIYDIMNQLQKTTELL
jgi:hypothetical protein